MAFIKHVLLCLLCMLAICQVVPIPNALWLTPVLIYSIIIVLVCHGIFSNAKRVNYIFASYFCLMLVAPLFSSKFLFPFLISPRRVYATLIKRDHDPWHPPNGVTTFVMTQTCLLTYLFLINYVILKLVCLRRCKTSKVDVLLKYAAKMTAAAYIVYLLFKNITSLGGIIDLIASWVPFASDMVMGIPMAMIMTFMLFYYQDQVVLKTCNQKLPRLKFWQDII